MRWTLCARCVHVIHEWMDGTCTLSIVSLRVGADWRMHNGSWAVLRFWRGWRFKLTHVIRAGQQELVTW